MNRTADQFDERSRWIRIIGGGLDADDPMKQVCDMAEWWLHRAAQEIRDRDALVEWHAIGRYRPAPPCPDEQGGGGGRKAGIVDQAAS
jgi:hypothetical protein